MDTNRLRQFCTLVETENMRKASELLHMSHSALSKSIKTLEGQLGVPLIMAHGRGIKITERGQRVYQGAVRLLEQVDQFTNEARSVDTGQATVRIGTFEVFSTYFFGHYAASHRQENLRYLVRETTPGFMETDLLKGTIDYGITYLPIPKQGLKMEKCAQITMGLFGQSSMSKLALKDMHFCAPAIPVTGAPNRVRGLDGWPDDKIERSITYQVDMLESGLDLCRRGLAVIWAPKFLIGLHNENLTAKGKLVELEPDGLPKQRKHPVYLVTRSGYIENDVSESIKAALESCMGCRR
jgi:DNA-binding transcriptional LysR family regulator